MVHFSAFPRLVQTWFRCVVNASSMCSWATDFPSSIQMAWLSGRKRSLFINLWITWPVHTSRVRLFGSIDLLGSRIVSPDLFTETEQKIPIVQGIYGSLKRAVKRSNHGEY